MINFNEFGLSKNLIESLKRSNYIKPTDIQAAAIPLAMEGKDIIGSAQTGTGKTGAFGIPLLNKLMTNPLAQGLIITPTRELANQVLKNLQQLLGKDSNIRSVALIGGESIMQQIKLLKGKARLIVGTPGRINDHILRRSLDLRNVSYLVLDETDRMLDMGFSIQIDKIIAELPKERQTLLFSATMPKSIVNITKNILIDPVRISVGEPNIPVDKIKQEIIYVKEELKYLELNTQLDKRNGSIIVFVKTKHGTEKLTKMLSADNHDVNFIHGDLRHSKRESVIRAFRNRKYRILIATDIAARGLDIPHIEHVINYDLPQAPEDYIHRIGRTARAQAEGEAVCLISNQDKSKWFAINRLIDPKNDNNKNFGGEFRKTGSNNAKKPRKNFGRDSFSKDRAGKDMSGKDSTTKDKFGKSRTGRSKDASERRTGSEGKFVFDKTNKDNFSKTSKPKNSFKRGFNKKKKIA